MATEPVPGDQLVNSRATVPLERPLYYRTALLTESLEQATLWPAGITNFLVMIYFTCCAGLEIGGIFRALHGTSLSKVELLCM